MLPSRISVCCTSPFWSGSLCLFGFCLPCLQCLISALTQAGGGGLLFRFASSVQSCCGEGGLLQTDIAVCGEHPPCSGHTGFAPAHGCLCFPRLHCSGSRLLYRERALRCLWFQFSCTPQKRGLGCACVLCLPRPERLRQPGAWRAHSSQVWCAFSPPRPQPRFLRALVGCQQLEFVLRSWPLAATLPAADVDHPESQEVFG